MSSADSMGWSGVVRLGLVQAMLGAVVVLTSSTLNRVMVVELALPALLPGLLLTLHYAVQLTRPRMGYGSDRGGRRTPWILGGMAVLALGGFGAAVATAWMSTHVTAGILLAVLSYALVGLGVSAAGTSLLVLLAKRVSDEKRASAATVVWVMMIMGFAVTAGMAGQWLDPYSPTRLVLVSGTVSLVALAVSIMAVRGLEASGEGPASASPAPERKAEFKQALREVWAEPDARRFTIFVFVSMLAYSMQDLILEPFAGTSFAFTPGDSTKLSGLQHGGSLVGMLLAALAGRRLLGIHWGSLRAWMIGGCVASAAALFGLVLAAHFAPHWPLRLNVFLLGLANGAFAIAAIGSMMSLAHSHASETRRAGTRMGLWGASQAIGFALGGLVGAAASDLVRWIVGSPGLAYALVFFVEGLIFLAAAGLAISLRAGRGASASRAGHARDVPDATPAGSLNVGGVR